MLFENEFFMNGESQMLLSVIIPMYNEQEVISETYKRLTAILSKIDNVMK